MSAIKKFALTALSLLLFAAAFALIFTLTPPAQTGSAEELQSPAPMAEGQFGKDGNAVYATGEEFFSALEAASGGTFTITQKGEYSVESLTVPAGVTLVLPYEGGGAYSKNGGSIANNYGWSDPQNQYISLTVSGQLTVRGTLYLGGVMSYAGQTPMQGHTSGAYSRLVLNGPASVEEGGVLDIRGLVTGTGNIVVQSGGKLYQPFVVMDYMGGTLTVGFYANSKESPFKRYAMPNIQCSGGYTVHHGGYMYGHVSLYTDKKSFIPESYNNAEVLLMAAEGAMINLPNPSSQVTAIYYPDQNCVLSAETNNTSTVGRTELNFKGGASFAGMTIKITVAFISEKVDTSQVLFPIPYNYHLSFAEGDYALTVPFKLLPGATAVVEEGAALNVQSRLAVFDGMEQGTIASRTYPTSAQLKAAGLTSNAGLFVNGTLNVEAGAEFTGVVQTSNTSDAAKIVIAEGATLSQKVTDGCRGGSAMGLSNSDACNYFENDTSARVWDKAHSVLAALKASTYYSTGDTSFVLPQNSQTAKKETVNSHSGSEHTLAPVTLPQVDGMQGSWRIEHSQDIFDWQPKEGENANLSAQNPVITLTRTCTETGCGHTQTKNLLYLPESLGDVTYRGTAYTLEEIKEQLFEKYFSGGKVGGFSVALSDISGEALTQGQAKDCGEYTFTAALTSGYFLKDGQYVEEASLKFKIIPFTITNENVTITQPQMQYTGQGIEPAYTVTWAGTGDVTYEATWQNNKYVGDHAQLIITANGQFTGVVTAEFKITPKPITVTVKNKQAVYTGGEQTYTGGQILLDYTLSEDLHGEDLQITLTASGTAAGNYNITANSANPNYAVTFVGENGKQGVFTITPAPVTFTLEKEQYAYTGSIIRPKVIAKWGQNNTLEEDKFGVAYGENLNVDGTNTVTVQITDNNFTVYGANKNQTLPFTITPKNIAGATVTVSGEYTYTGSPIEPGYTKISASADGLQVTFSEEISYGENTNVLGGGSVTITGVGNFAGTATGTFIIRPKDITGATVNVTTPADDIIYKNAQWQPTFTVTVDGIEGTLTDSDYDVTYGDNTNAGEGKITINGKNNFTGTATQTFIIKARPLTIKVNGGNIPFGKFPAEPYALTITGLLGDVEEDTLKEKLKYTVQSPQSLEAGNVYTVTPAFKEGESLLNYAAAFEAGRFKIVDAELGNVAFTGETSVVYNGESHRLEVTNLPAEADSVKIKYNGEEAEPIDEGAYTVTAEITFKNGAVRTLSGGTLTVTPKTVQITVKRHAVIYNGEEQSLIQSADSWQDLEGGILARDKDNVTITLTAAGTEAKSYAVTAVEGGANAHNYKMEYTGLENGYVISPKDITAAKVTVDGNYTYTGNEITPQKADITVTLSQWNKPIDFTVTYYNNNTNAGKTAQVTVTGSGNYTGTATGNFEIKAKSIAGAIVTITTPAADIVYKNAQWQPLFTVTVDGISAPLTNGDYNVTYGANTNAGEGKITISGKGNFMGEAIKTFTIKQKEVTLTLQPQSAVYNGTDQTVSSSSEYWSADGVVEGDDLQVKLQGTKKEVGSAKISVASVNSNYRLTNTPEAVFTITAKRIDVTIKNQTAVYSNSTPEVKQEKGVAWESDGVCGNDELGITIEKSAGVAAAEYELTAKATNPNYIVTFKNEKGEEQPAVFKITKKTVVITVTPQSTVYGEPIATLTYTHEGVIEGDNFDIRNYVHLTTDAEQYSDVDGNYTITATADEADNYEIDCTSTAKYTITARNIKITIQNQTGVYNGKLPVPVNTKYDITEGNIVNNDDLGVTLTISDANKNVGEYTITGDWTDKNYNVTFTTGIYSITKRDISENITITVNGQTASEDNITVRYEGQTLIITGLVYSDIEEDADADITVIVTPSEIDKEGLYSVKAVIEDGNYSGERTFGVTVTDEAGYTEKLRQTLAELEELTTGIDANAFKQSDFEALKTARQLIDGLSEAERSAAQDELKRYEDLISGWNSAAAEVPAEIKETAQKIGAAPLAGLIESVSAILALAYIISKGVKLI